MDAMSAEQDAFRRRLSGSQNSIMWRPNDLAAIAKKTGIAGYGAPLTIPAAIPTIIKAPTIRGKPNPDRQFEFTVSTGTVDRMGDSISVSGWRLGTFRSNPIVLYAHNSKTLPIGR